jgi:hypothetical protein
MKIPLIFLVIFGFLAGLYYCSVSKSNTLIEGMHSNEKHFRCPDILVQKGAKFLLYNSKVAKVPGVNPIEFQNLEDYSEFIDWQRSQGIRCPVLYLQHSYNTQGESEYKIRPSPNNLQGGMPSAIPHAQKKGVTNHLPMSPAPTGPSKDEGLLYSPDAMDDNWGGQEYTQQLVDEGYYKGNEVSIAIE